MSKYLGGGMDGGEVGEGEQNKEGMEIDGLRGLYHSLGMEIAKGFLIQGVTFFVKGRWVCSCILIWCSDPNTNDVIVIVDMVGIWGKGNNVSVNGKHSYVWCIWTMLTLMTTSADIFFIASTWIVVMGESEKIETSIPDIHPIQ